MTTNMIYDVFVSHAGESKAFARQLAERLGGEDGTCEPGLGLRAFLDQDALVPGDLADEEMLAHLESTPVGIILLDDFFLKKKYPVEELRVIMKRAEVEPAAGKLVPVMYSRTYENLSAEIDRLSRTASDNSSGANSEDAKMLAKLKRITMIHSDVEYVNRFLDNICFAVLRHLVNACKSETHHRPIQKTVYILNVRGAIKYVAEDGHFQHLSGKDKLKVKEWVKKLDTLYQEMQDGQSDQDLPQPLDHIEGCKKLADDLEQEFAQPALQKHLRTIKKKAAEFPSDKWPQALWWMPDEEAEPIWDAMRMLWPFWRKVQRLYRQKRLLQPGEDSDQPLGFFNRSWAGRGSEYRNFVEPVDIANWYQKNKHVDIITKDPTIASGHYVDFPDGVQMAALSAEDNKRRPGRYILLQEEEKRVFGGEYEVNDSLTKGYEFKKLLGDRRWQEVAPRDVGNNKRFGSLTRLAVDVAMFVAGVFVGRRLG